VKALRGDVRALLDAGMLSRTANGGIEFPFQAVKVELMLQTGQFIVALWAEPVVPADSQDAKVPFIHSVLSLRVRTR